MKLKILTLSIALAYSNAYSQNLQTSGWETNEYSKSRTLPAIKASSAYSRGYTGKGAVIAILDSGIDVNSAEFKDKILVTRNFSSTTSIQDTIGHGTHVAGIAAAARNGSGVHGVAPDAKLIIGKITSSGLITSTTALTAVKWASDTGADVVNLSSGFRLTASAISPTLVSPGVYKTSFTNTGKIAGGFDPNQWRAAIGKEMVLVVSSGNDNTAWSGSLPQMASTTDSSGNLLLNGQMLVVGNWNSQGVTTSSRVNGKTVITTTYQTGPNNNGAAHLCMVMTNNVCQDKYKLSDFYILAPGVGINSVVPTSVNKTGMLSLSGTSMAAPAVSGGVAIIRQMWPQMSGSNIVKLLLVTADKTIQGYNVNLHGQGLLDMDKATRPIGSLGIPTTGRLTGPSVPGSDPLLITGGTASIGNKTNIMVVDDFQRDFYVPGKTFVARTNTGDFNPKRGVLPYESLNNYTQFNDYGERLHVSEQGIEVSLYKDNNRLVETPTMVEMAFNKHVYDLNMRLSVGAFSEFNTWLGNSLQGFTGTGKNTTSATQFVGLGVDKLINDTKIYASLQQGFTKTNARSENITNISTVLSYSWTLGLEHKVTEKNTFGIMAYQPVSVYHASANLSAPVGLDNEFNIVQSSKVNLAADIKETRLGLYHRFDNAKGFKSLAYIESRQNYKGQDGVTDTAVGLQLTNQF